MAYFVFRSSETLLVVTGLETLLVLDACKLKFNVYTSNLVFSANITGRQIKLLFEIHLASSSKEYLTVHVATACGKFIASSLSSDDCKLINVFWRKICHTYNTSMAALLYLSTSSFVIIFLDSISNVSSTGSKLNGIIYLTNLSCNNFKLD